VSNTALTPLRIPQMVIALQFSCRLTAIANATESWNGWFGGC